MERYFVDRNHKKIVKVDEFQHHGILGQKWGVITRHVGVNYIPIGRKDKEVSSKTARTLSDNQKDVVRQVVASKMGNMPHNFVDINSKVMNKYYDRIEQKNKFQKGKMSYQSLKREIDKINQETVNKFWKNLKQYEKEHPDIKKGWDSYSEYREYLAKNNSIELSTNADGTKLVMSMIDDAPLELCIDYGGLINPTAQTLLFNP